MHRYLCHRSTRIISIALYILCTVCGISYAKSPPPGTGGSAPTNVLLMLDVSGSMATVQATGDTRYPVDIAHDSNGNIYVARKFDSIEKYDSSGKFLLNIGQNSNYRYNGVYNQVYAIDVDANDNVYVSDSKNGRIQKFSSEGVYLSKMNLWKKNAKGLAIDKNNNIYAVNGYGRVEKFNSYGTRLQTWSNTKAEHIATDANNNVYITTYSHKKILKYNSSGQLQKTIYTSIKPFGIDVAQNGTIYVSELNNDRIYAYSASGSYIQSWGGTGSGTGKFDYPRGLDFSDDGTLWVADYQNNRIQSLTGDLKFSVEEPLTRLEQAAKIIKGIVSDSNLTDKVNFGLMTWSSNSSMDVNIGPTGASSIFNLVDTLHPSGSTNMDGAMTLAQTYLLGPSSPMDANASCQKNMLIVITDGEWSDGVASNIAGSLYDNYKVRGFMVGFQAPQSANYVAQNYKTFSQKGGTYPDSPLYADTWQELNDVLRAYIRLGIDTRLTYSAPTIIPGPSGNDYIMQSTFQYNPNHQWNGHLVKYNLNSDGTLGASLWDAGSLLSAVTADSRNIWTVATSLAQGINNFTVDKKELLRSALEENKGTAFTNTELSDLISFIRGKDSYNEFSGDVDDTGASIISGERWKLGDIYHSRAIVAGPPSALSSNGSAVNSESYYRYANGYESFKSSNLCGVACSNRPSVIYAGANDGMLHAFSSATGQELWAFIPPGILPKFKDMIATGSKSNSIYGVDGSPTVKDIYYDGKWRTVLMGGLRQGGHSYYALDVTNASAPKHLFSFAFNPIINKVSYWNASGTRTDYNASGSIPNAYDVSALGEAWSQPAIVKIRIGGADKWVAVIAGGYNNGINPNYGTRVFILDLADGGKILNTLTLADGHSSNGIINAIPPKVTAITSDDTSLFSTAGALIYVNDLEGKQWKINLTTNGTLYEKTKLFDTGATDSNDRYSFHETSATVDEKGNLVQYFGTGNLQALERISGSIANKGYGILDTHFPNYTNVTSQTNTSLRNITSTCPSNSQKGWYTDFNANEKISAKATIKNRTVYFSRFTPNTGDVCEAGTARLSEHDFMCGATTRSTSLGGGIATEAVVYKNKIYIGISDDRPVGSLPAGFTKHGNLIIGGANQSSSGKVEIESWWEDF